jgi:hypothetical protein
MNPFPTPTLRAGVILAFLTMAAIGWKLADEPERPAADQPAAATRTTDRPTRANRRGGPPDAVRQRVAALRAIASPDERLRATMALARSLPVSEIPAWLDGRWFPAGGGFDLMLFNKLLKERWQQEDPEALLAWSFKNNSSQARATLTSWAKTDPQRALDYLKANPNRELEIQVLTEIARTDPALALRALGEQPAAGRSDSGMSDYYLQQLFQQLAKSSPAALENALAALPPGLRFQAEVALINDRMATSFDTEIRKLWERPDGWRIFEQLKNDGRDLNSRIFAELANLPPAWRARLADNAYRFVGIKDAEKWIHADLEGCGFTAAQAKTIRTQGLSTLASQSPETVLKLMAEMDLESHYRRNIIGNLFANFRGSPDQADALLALLGSDEDRQMARDLANRPREESLPKIEQPTDWLAQAGRADTKSGFSTSYQYLSMLRGWNADKIATLSSEFQTLPADQKRQVAKLLTGNSGYVDNITSLQGEALRYLIANPEPKPTNTEPVFDPAQAQRLPDGTLFTPADRSATDSARVSQASQFAVNWAKRDPAAASDWVQSLPAGDARLWAQKNLAANWSQVDPEAADHWLSTLPAADRAQVREFLKGN